MTLRLLLATLVLAAVALAVPAPASATPSKDACTTILSGDEYYVTNPGVYCLDADVIAPFQEAFEVSGENITIDCRGHRLVGSTYSTEAIRAIYAHNFVVRNCDISGFQEGIHVDSGHGWGDWTGANLIEDNRLHDNVIGIYVDSEHTTVRRNEIVDSAAGIQAQGNVDVLDNAVSWRKPPPYAPTGVQLHDGMSARIAGNRIHGLDHFEGKGIVLSYYQKGDGRVIVEDNVVMATGVGSVGIQCQLDSYRVRDNLIGGFDQAMTGCSDAGENDITP